MASSAGGVSAGWLNPDAVTVGFSDTAVGSDQRIGAAGQRVLSGSTRAVRPLGSYRLGAAGTCDLPEPASGSGTGETLAGGLGGAAGVLEGLSNGGGASSEASLLAGV